MEVNVAEIVNYAARVLMDMRALRDLIDNLEHDMQVVSDGHVSENPEVDFNHDSNELVLAHRQLKNAMMELSTSFLTAMQQRSMLAFLRSGMIEN